MANNTHIPRQTDREIVEALVSILNEAGSFCELSLFINVPPVGDQQVALPIEALPNESDVKVLLDENSVISPSIYLRGPGNTAVVYVQRIFEESFDVFRIEDEWRRHLNEQQKQRIAQFTIKLSALCRKHLKAHDVDASITSDPTSAWSKYRTAQAGVLNSLQKTAEHIIVDVANKNAEIDKLRAQRFEELERNLRAELAAERENMLKQHESSSSELLSRIKAHEEKEAAFETKEARYVARKQQQEQIEEVKKWLEEWGVTPGTKKSRAGVFWSYVAALSVTGLLACYATYSNYSMIKSVDDFVKMQWWQVLTLFWKSFFPLLAFTTLMIYFIRWATSWARQHADEDFINRARLIDIGRSGWLLEAVRDAQEREGGSIPPELLKELSKNLFNYSGRSSSDDGPQAAADMLLQGLSSLRVKSADGTEVEAKRGK